MSKTRPSCEAMRSDSLSFQKARTADQVLDNLNTNDVNTGSKENTGCGRGGARSCCSMSGLRFYSRIFRASVSKTPRFHIPKSENSFPIV